MSKKATTIIIHTLVWTIFISIPIIFFTHPVKDALDGNSSSAFGLPEIIAYLSFIIFFYLNAYYLIPTFLSKNKIIVYVILILALSILVATPNAIINFYYRQSTPIPRPFIKIFFFRLFYCLTNIAVSSSYRFIIDNIRHEKERKEKETETLKTELSFLRSQVSPHFMFNILNNMVSLARKKSDRLEPILMELSNLLRYMLYESNEEKVSLIKEVEYLKSYIDLQLLRFGDDVKVNFKVSNNSIMDNEIEPMLFIPLVENAFKHGAGMVINPTIDINLSITEDTAVMTVSNKYNNQTQDAKDENSGIGLSNLKRRLDLLYPKSYHFENSSKDNMYLTTLNLKLK